MYSQINTQESISYIPDALQLDISLECLYVDRSQTITAWLHKDVLGFFFLTGVQYLSDLHCYSPLVKDQVYTWKQVSHVIS